jgi:hypothetical protein
MMTPAPRAVAALAAAIAVLASFASACSASPASQPPADPQTELRQAGQTLAGLKSVTVDLKFGAGVVYQGFTLTAATMKVKLPGTSDTVLKVKQNDFLVDLEVITVPGHVYLKVPFGKFSELTTQQSGELPDMSALFDAQKGLPAILASGTAPRRTGSERIGNIDCDKLATTFTAAQLGSALGGFKPGGDIAATIWISPSDHLVRRVLLSGPLVDPTQTTTVQVDLHDFNGPLNVTPPPPTP